MLPSFKQYLVEEEREIFFTFGRMNPPTIGHGKLLDALNSKSGKNPYKVFLSQSQDPKKNPLTYQQKVKHVRKMFPAHARNVLLNMNIKTVFDAATNLYGQGFKRITMVVGSDRVTEFKTLLEKYNGVKGRHGFYNFERINVASAGERDPDAEGVEGMSASKQRDNAQNNDFTRFSQGVPKNMSNKDAKRLFNDVRSGMGLKETSNFKQHIEFQSVSEEREKFIQGQLYEPGDRVIVKESQQTGRIYRLGTNYVIVSLDEGRITRQWIDGIEKIDDIDEGTSAEIKRWFDRHKNKEKYEKVVRMYLNLRRKNPGKATANLRKVAKITGADIRNIDKVLRDMVKSGAMPKHLVNYQTLQYSETYSPQKHEWGTDASRKFATQMTPGQDVSEEDEVSSVRKSIDQELATDKKRHDRMLDRARLARTRRKNRETDPKEGKEKNVKFDVKDTVGQVVLNPVAKHAPKFNKSLVYRDRKKDDKRGYTKHKKI
jgi:hypothetical protein